MAMARIRIKNTIMSIMPRRASDLSISGCIK